MNETKPASPAAPPPAWRRPVVWIVVVLWIPVVVGLGWLQWRSFQRARERQEARQREILDHMRNRVREAAPPMQLGAPVPPPITFRVTEGSVRRAAKRLVGLDGPREFARGVADLRVDASLGSSDAMVLLADALLTGDPGAGFAPDLQEAKGWLQRAAANSNQMAPFVQAKLRRIEAARAAPGTTERAPVREAPPAEVMRPDEPPQSIQQRKPEYPLPLRYLGVAGEVTVEFVVDAGGAVRDAHTVEASHAAFGPPAVAAVREWTFRPGRKNGRPVATRMRVPVIFELE